MHTLNNEEQEKCRPVMGLFKVLSESKPNIVKQFCHLNIANL